MATNLIKYIKINGLQYNPQRDPQAYRRVVTVPFRIQVALEGSGQARCALHDDTGTLITAKTVALPGTFAHDMAYPTAGSRLVTFSAEVGPEKVERDLRLDVTEHAWIG
jgi:hypothetical protein